MIEVEGHCIIVVGGFGDGCLLLLLSSLLLLLLDRLHLQIGRTTLSQVVYVQFQIRDLKLEGIKFRQSTHQLHPRQQVLPCQRHLSCGRVRILQEPLQPFARAFI